MKQNEKDLSRDEVRTLVVEPMLDEDDDEISLSEVILSVLRDWKILLAAAVLCALLGVAAARLLPGSPATKSYTASATMYIAKEDAAEDVKADTPLDMMMVYMMMGAKQNYNPMQDIEFVLKDPASLQRIIDDLKLDMEISELAENIELPTERYGRMVRVDYTDSDPERAEAVLERLCAVSVDSLSELLKGETLNATNTRITVEEKGTDGGKRSAKKLAVLGGAAGFLLCALLSALLAIFDKRLKNSEDVDRYLGLPVMAVVRADGKR